MSQVVDWRRVLARFMAVSATILLTVVGCYFRTSPEAGTPSDSSSSAPPEESAPAPLSHLDIPALAPLAASVSAHVGSVQPGRVEAAGLCPGSTVTLATANGELFPTLRPGLRVLFAPCGLEGEILDHLGDQLVVRVPERAISGPVWLAEMPAEQAQQRALHADACLASLRLHEPVPFFDPVVTCERLAPASSEVGEERAGIDAFSLSCEHSPTQRAAGLDFVLESDLAAIGRLDQPAHVEAMCFATCQEFRFGVGGTSAGGAQPINHIEVKPAPRIRWFRAQNAIRMKNGSWSVERGQVQFEWNTDAAPGAEVELAVGGGQAVKVSGSGKARRLVEQAGEAVLTTRSACGVRRAVLRLEPTSTLRLNVSEVRLDPGAEVEVEVSLTRPLTKPLELSAASSSSRTVHPVSTRLRIAAGARSTKVRLKRAESTRWAKNGTMLAEISIRPAGAIPTGLTILPPRPLKVRASGSYSQVAQPGAGQVRVRGVLQYRECIAWNDSKSTNTRTGRCLSETGNPLYRPIRRARFEVWLQGAGIFDSLEHVGETDEKGAFDVLVRAHAGARYDVTVVASGPAGDVDMRPGMWFYQPLKMARPANAGVTLGFNWNASSRTLAKHFNALDAIYAGWKYARLRLGLNEAAAANVLKRVRVIPTLSQSAWTMPMGEATHIWAGQNNQVFEDGTMLHEYAHHLQRMNNSWAAWPANHNKCYASLYGTCDQRINKYNSCPSTDTEADGICWINSPEYAWFEGFPEYFRFAVLKWDAAQDKRLRGTKTPYWKPSITSLSSNPTNCQCPLVSSPHQARDGRTIVGSFVEDYVAGGLLDLAQQKSLVASNGAKLSLTQVEDMIMKTWFFDAKDEMCTTARFRTLFGARLRDVAPLTRAFAPYGL